MPYHLLTETTAMPFNPDHPIAARSYDLALSADPAETVDVDFILHHDDRPLRASGFAFPIHGTPDGLRLFLTGAIRGAWFVVDQRTGVSVAAGQTGLAALADLAAQASLYGWDSVSDTLAAHPDIATVPSHLALPSAAH